MTGTASEIRTVAVVGGGLMGSGIAEAVASAGLEVILRDIDDAGVERAHERIEGSLQRGVRGGKLDEADAAGIRDRIALTTDLARVGDADLVVEAVPEDEQLKLEVIAAIGEAVSERAIIASNTSSIPITQLAHVVTRPERVVGTPLLLAGAGDAPG